MPRLLGREIDVVVFDKDGVLLDFHARWRAVARARAAALAARLEAARPEALVAGALTAFGLHPETGHVRPDGLLATGTRAEAETLAAGLLADWSRARGGPLGWPECRARAAEAFLEAEAAVPPEASEQAIPGALEAVRRLHAAGFRLAVATSDRHEPTSRFLARHGVLGHFAMLAGADTVPRVKPAPDALLAIAGALGVPPARLAMVGDLPVDLRMARAAGAGLAVGALTGLGTAATLAEADAVLATLGELA